MPGAACIENNLDCWICHNAAQLLPLGYKTHVLLWYVSLHFLHSHCYTGM